MWSWRTRLPAGSRLSRPLLAASLALHAGCGRKNTPDLQALDGELGTVKGVFRLRLAQTYRGELADLEARLEKAIPGTTIKLVRRFRAEDKVTDKAGTRLSDLLRITVPNAADEGVNRFLFRQLARLEFGRGQLFERIDTEKYVKTRYDPAATATPDPDLAQQYYLDMIEWPAAVRGLTPAQIAAAAPVVVAVLDTGVDGAHEDLAGSMWTGASGDAGYDATINHVLSPAEVVDGNGHGTNVAGIIAAQGDNGVGIHGISFVGRSLAQIMPVKVLNDQGAGTSDSTNAGIKWAVEQHLVDKQQDPTRAKQKLIINLSLGGPFEASGYAYPKDQNGNYLFEDDVLNYATQNDDVLVIVAAGNESCGISGACDISGQSFQETFYYPCSYDHVLCVAASTNTDTLAGFSNRKASVGITAPGYQILSTAPTAPAGSTTPYQYYSGTSQATPVVAGAASVLWALYPGFTAVGIKSILEQTASKVTDITAQIVSGNGRLDLRAALAYAAQLQAAGKTPDQLAPDGTIVSAAKIQASVAAAPGLDPNAKSKDATATSPDSKGKGSGNGCGVVGPAAPPGAAGRVAALAALLAPLVLLLAGGARSRRPARRRTAPYGR